MAVAHQLKKVEGYGMIEKLLQEFQLELEVGRLELIDMIGLRNTKTFANHINDIGGVKMTYASAIALIKQVRIELDELTDSKIIDCKKFDGDYYTTTTGTISKDNYSKLNRYSLIVNGDYVNKIICFIYNKKSYFFELIGDELYCEIYQLKGKGDIDYD